MRAVVVGGQGFLGGAIVSELCRRGDAVTVFDIEADVETCDRLFGRSAVEVVRGDVTVATDVRAVVNGADEVYHLAGVLGTSELEDSVVDAIHGNVIGSVNVFEAAVAAGVPTVFFPSKPNVWLNTYTITKHAAERFALLYGDLHPVRIPSLRYFNAYGPRQSCFPVRKMIPAFAVQALRGAPLTVYGDGLQTVDLIFAPDLARLTVDFTRSGWSGEALDCGRGIRLSVLEVATAVNDVLDNRAGVRHLPMRRGETPATDLVADVEPLAKAIGPLSYSDFEASLGETLRWYADRSDDELAFAAAALGSA